MNKKLLVSVLLCFFVFSLGMIADEKPKAKTIEHLVWAHTGAGNFFHYTIFDNCDLAHFETSPFLTFHVPLSPKAEALLFEFQGMSMILWWTGCTPQNYGTVLKTRLFSEVIPDDIQVHIQFTFDPSSPSNFTGDNWQRMPKRYVKVILRRDGLLGEFPDYWEVRYVNSGDFVSPDKAQGILNDLMDNGFYAEVWASGHTAGIREFFLGFYHVEVTRLVKK